MSVGGEVFREGEGTTTFSAGWLLRVGRRHDDSGDGVSGET